MFSLNKNKTMSIKEQNEQIARILRTTPESINAFENAYADVEEPSMHDIARGSQQNYYDEINVDSLVDRIVNEFYYMYGQCLPPANFNNPNSVTQDELMSLPENIRPQITPTLAKRDAPNENTSYTLCMMANTALTSTKPAVAMRAYNMFRQGLDILDIDPLTYAMIDTNPNSMSHWIGALEYACKNSNLKIPKTRIHKMPLAILQLMRTDAMNITDATKQIINRVVYNMFDLKDDGDYFVKTGTFSNKFDFRNCHVTGASEIRELGEYLYYIHVYALSMASSIIITPDGRTIQRPSCYGVSTTTEWVVRDYIEDVEDAPTIYHGMPLHTEYRTFVDFDTKKVIGCANYWDPDVMLKRFSEDSDNQDPTQRHDYVTYRNYQDVLVKRYESNKDKVCSMVESLLSDMYAQGMRGQYSLDIMQNGDDFYAIDMSFAKDSAYNDVIPLELRDDQSLTDTIRAWLPELPSA